MTDLHDRPNYPHGALLNPLTDAEQAEYLQSRNRYQRDDLDAMHTGPRGISHDPFWVVRKRFGLMALELKCERGLLDNENRLWRCGEARRVSTGKFTWDAVRGRPGVARNVHKSRVLAALARLGGAATVGELTEACGLERATVAGCLAGSQRAKVPYVVRSASRETTPLGSAHVWSLSDRGRAWLVWAVQVGLLSTRKKGA